jgi:hypothetical protein
MARRRATSLMRKMRGWERNPDAFDEFFLLDTGRGFL